MTNRGWNSLTLCGVWLNWYIKLMNTLRFSCQNSATSFCLARISWPFPWDLPARPHPEITKTNCVVDGRWRLSFLMIQRRKSQFARKEFTRARCSFVIFATMLKNRLTNMVSLYVCLLCSVWIIYEQVMIAALDCSRDDLAWVSFLLSNVLAFSHIFNWAPYSSSFCFCSLKMQLFLEK